MWSAWVTLVILKKNVPALIRAGLANNFIIYMFLLIYRLDFKYGYRITQSWVHNKVEKRWNVKNNRPLLHNMLDKLKVQSSTAKLRNVQVLTSTQSVFGCQHWRPVLWHCTTLGSFPLAFVNGHFVQSSWTKLPATTTVCQQLLVCFYCAVLDASPVAVSHM